MKICRKVCRGVFAPSVYETRRSSAFSWRNPKRNAKFFDILHLSIPVICCKRSNLFWRGHHAVLPTGIDVLTWEMGQTEPLGNGDSTGPILPIPSDSYKTKRAITNKIKAKKLGHIPHQNNSVHVRSHKGMNPRLWCKSLMFKSPVCSRATQKSLSS